jgi:hypothetical protein
LSERSFKGSDPVQLITYLERHRNFLATDPRDKVFAMLGIATDVSSRKFKVEADYSKNTKEVYLNLAKGMIESGNLYPLDIPRMIETDSAFLPSWVPNWNAWDMQHHYSLRSAGFKHAASAMTSVCFRVQDTTLEFRGQIHDHIEEIGYVNPAEDQLTRQHTFGFPAATLRITRVYRNWERVEVYVRTLWGNKIPERTTKGRVIRIDDVIAEEKEISAVLHFCKPLSLLPEFFPPLLGMIMWSWVFIYIAWRVLTGSDTVKSSEDFGTITKDGITPGRRMFRIKKGLIGLVPGSAEKVTA